MLRSLLVALFALSFFPATGQKAVLLDRTDALYTLGSEIAVLADSSGLLTFEQVLETPADKFEPGRNGMNYGFSQTAYWLKFSLKNGITNFDEWAIQLTYPLLDSIAFYYMASDSTWKSYEAGDNRPFWERQYQFRNVMFPVHFNGHEQTFYMRVKTNSSIRAELQITSKDFWHDFHSEEEMMYGFFYGAMMVMVLYNLLIFLTLKDISYLYYVLSTSFSLLFFAGLSGHTFQYLWPGFVAWGNHSMPISMGILAFFIVLFSKSFLNTKKYAPFFDKILIGLMALGMFVAVSEFILGYATVVALAAATLLLVAFSVIGAGAMSWFKGNKTARYFLLAWCAYLIGGVMIILVNFGVLPANALFTNSVKIGSIMEVVLLSLALSDKYRLFKEEKEQAQVQLLQVEQRAKDTLTLKVIERTSQLAEANEELHQTVEELHITNEALGNTNQILDKTNQELRRKNQAITDSINYAKRIQQSFLPPKQILQKAFAEHFTLFMPRDVVSGDFYWYEQIGQKHILVVADCTGHGVPGAFMSMLGNDSLVNVVVRNRIAEPDKILHAVNAEIKQILRQDITANRDGMDASVIVYDADNQTISFAGAKRPLVWFDKRGEMHKIKGTRFSLAGDGDGAQAKDFEVHVLPVSDISCLYLFTDGYADQFGGENDSKLLTKRFYRWLEEVQAMPLEAQHEMLYMRLMEWKGEQRQTDDILVVGVRF